MSPTTSFYHLNFPVFLPISFITVLWQFFVLIYIITDFVLTIMVQCFQQQFLNYILYNYFDRFLIIILVFDILFSLNTCYIKKGIVISERKQIALAYVKSIYFWIDLISLIMSILQLNLNEEKNYQTSFNFIVFIKIIKVIQFDRNIKRYALKTFNALLIYEILKNIFFLALLCHIMGCFFYLIDLNLIKQNYYVDEGGPLAYWLLTSSAYQNIILQPFWIKYTYCFYFSTSLLSGIAYGDLVPQNPIETAYVCFIMLLPLVIYSYIFNAIYSVISKKRQRNKQVKRYQFLAKRYLNTLRVRSALQKKLITYLSYVFKKSTSSADFIDSLAPSSKKTYQTHTIHAKFDFFIFEQLLSMSPLTDRFIFRDEVMGLITEQTFPQRYKMILAPNRIKLYYINQGICKRVTNMTIKYSDNINRKQFACFYPFIGGVINQKLKYQSASFVIAQTINRKAFLQLLKDRRLTELKEAFFLMKEEKILYNNQTVIGQNCFFCNSQAHCIDDCKYLRPNVRIYTNNFRFSVRKPYFRGPKKMKRRIEKDYKTNDQQQTGKGQMGVQWKGNNSDNHRQVIDHTFETVTSQRIYYPQFNISQ